MKKYKKAKKQRDKEKQDRQKKPIKTENKKDGKVTWNVRRSFVILVFHVQGEANGSDKRKATSRRR